MDSISAKLVSYWECSTNGDTLADALGRNNLAVQSPNPSLVSGPQGQALSIETYSSAYYKTNPSEMAHRNVRTVTFWCKYSAGTEGFYPFVIKNPVGAGNELHMRVVLSTHHASITESFRGKIIMGTTGDVQATKYTQSSQVMPAADYGWHQVTCGWDPTTQVVRFWFDGSYVEDSTNAVTLPTLADTLVLSTNLTELSDFDPAYNYGVWGIGYWNRMLTNDEVTWLYNSGTGRRASEVANRAVDADNAAKNPGVNPFLRRYMGHVNDTVVKP
jgi:hypothetical protein